MTNPPVPNPIEGPNDVFDDTYYESLEHVTVKSQEPFGKAPFTLHMYQQEEARVLPILFKQQDFALVLLLLNELQISQANDLYKMGLKAGAFNGQTASAAFSAPGDMERSREDIQSIKAGEYQAVLTSSEMMRQQVDAGERAGHNWEAEGQRAMPVSKFFVNELKVSTRTLDDGQGIQNGTMDFELLSGNGVFDSPNYARREPVIGFQGRPRWKKAVGTGKTMTLSPNTTHGKNEG
ncbi:hypothetical protein M407DRAFT_7985 [Tulasnella calospora MUT 4182]|uniref:Uncharacterized protein n=1 Tax=Tulasnella calospora MUT 4182 TaxID=1051891 RepID=A0A0C3LXK5_9AGAM|nr:hypothetical protein M407DRAFT_7985 [Tulasnella calospora MUT 4182]